MVDLLMSVEWFLFLCITKKSSLTLMAWFLLQWNLLEHEVSVLSWLGKTAKSLFNISFLLFSFYFSFDDVQDKSDS